MAEYIEREMARREFSKYFRDSKELVDNCDNLLCYLPSADVVEVVRCKDCKYYKRNGSGYGECPFFDEVKDDEYCSSGEAKMDGKDGVE